MDTDKSAPTPSATPSPTDRADAIGLAIEVWVVEHIHGSPVAQATEAYNHLIASLQALRDSIVRIV